MRGGVELRTPNSELRTPNCERGFSLLEVMVAGTLLAIAVIGMGNFFVSGQIQMETMAEARGALHAAQSKLAELQTLSFQQADLQGAAFPGVIHLDPGNPVILDDRGTVSAADDLLGYRRWIVVDVDDPANGSAQGAMDYKEVRVEVASDSGFGVTAILASLRGLIAR